MIEGMETPIRAGRVAGTGRSGSAPDRASIEFCGEVFVVNREPFTIGRNADLVVDDNRFLHRHLLAISSSGDLWILANVGTQICVTVSDANGLLEAFLSPGAVLPLVFDETVVRFTAGPTSYELSIAVPEPAFTRLVTDEHDEGDATAGRTDMTPDQLRLIVALAEPGLVGAARRATALPTSAEAAQRLGWTLTKFNRKLDNVCHKLSVQGVRGLHGAPGRLASNRRARLVEHALAARLVTRDDLAAIDGDARAAVGGP